jgi:hypothetical protein
VPHSTAISVDFPRRWRRSAHAPTRRKGKVHARQRLKAGKGQADTAHLKATGNHPRKSFINLLIYRIFHSRLTDNDGKGIR